VEKKNFKYTSALKVQEGISQPSQINPLFKIKKINKKHLSVSEYVSGIVSGDRIILSRAITLIESTLHEHNELAQQIIEQCLPYSEKSLRIGITGVPGVGKSTFIESFGTYLTSLGNKLAVLAIDPSSEKSKGSILGDKTRMEQLSADSNAFIRPSPSSGSLGGVARKTRETIILCEAAGFNIIFVETVGVGQSETAVHSMVDFFLLLMLAGAGDELQGIKRGIMEMADAIIINKADGENINNATKALALYSSALNLFPLTSSNWKPKVLTCSSTLNTGIKDIWNMIQDYLKISKENNHFEKNRKQQLKFILSDFINYNLNDLFYENGKVKANYDIILKNVIDEKISVYKAGQELINIFFEKDKLKNKL